jgi:hypothetical protein
MNNEAFRALVNKQCNTAKTNNIASSEKVKSTKVIAREAVENEFKINNKLCGRGGGGGRRGDGRRFKYDAAGSDSGNSSNDDDNNNHDGGEEQQQQLSSNDKNEPEWKRRRREKRMRDGGNGINDDDTNNNNRSVEYRDRAKERRMGNNNYLDYDDATLEGLVVTPSLLLAGRGGGGEEVGTSVQNQDRRKQAELTKYLGGDLEHTHLVKGLDKALAEKVRREERMMMMMMMKFVGPASQALSNTKEVDDDDDDDDDDLNRVLKDAQLKKEQESQLKGAGREEDWKSLQPKTELGKSILSYLLRKQMISSTSSSSLAATTTTTTTTTTALLASIQAPVVPTPPASNIISAVQKSIRLSVLTFSLESDVRQRQKAWEVPNVSRKAFGIHHSSEASTTRRMAPLNNHMIAAISKKLDGRRSGVSSHPNKSKYYESPSPVKRNRHESEIEECTIAKSAKSISSSVMKKKAENDDSDDDIFSNVDNYYLPPQAGSSSATSTSPSSKDDDANGNATKKEEARKESIFENLIPEMNSSTMALKQPTDRAYIMQQNPQNQSDLSGDRNVIDRDIFGGGSSSQLLHQRRRGPQSAAMDGVSMAAYQGGYGEDMDVDFGGNDDEEEDGVKKSDKWRKGKTGDKENAAYD